jgi:hypothetical protein
MGRQIDGGSLLIQVIYLPKIVFLCSLSGNPDEPSKKTPFSLKIYLSYPLFFITVTFDSSNYCHISVIA